MVQCYIADFNLFSLNISSLVIYKLFHLLFSFLLTSCSLQLYGTLDPKQRGSILAFNVLDSTGSIFPARLVRQLAERSNIFLDAGSLCNLSVARLLHLKSHKQIDSSSASPSQCDIQVVRLSLGPVSTFEDAYKLVHFLARFRDEDYMSYEAAGYVEELENEG